VNPTGLSSVLLSHILSGDHILVLSNEILSELARVLRYPRMVASHGRSEAQIYEFTNRLREISAVVPLNPLTFAPIRDEKDIHVMRTALHGDADVICTRDRDFFEPPASGFLASRGIKVLNDIS